MGLPSIDITFQTAAKATIAMGDKGYVGVIVRDTKQAGAHYLPRVGRIPAELTEDNRDYLTRAFLGYINPPKAVYLYVTDTDDTNLAKALAYFETQEVDYLVGPPDTTAEEAKAMVAWIKEVRAAHSHIKLVLPDTVADYDPVINFAAEGMTDGETVFTTAEYCSRMAGLFAGTPWNMSATYAPLPELTDITRLDKEAADAAIDAGKLILIHDGRQVKVARAVNSLTTTLLDHGAIFKKIKALEVVDRVDADFRATIEDTFIGKVLNTYDNRILLVTAGRGYFHTLETAGLLIENKSTLDIDTDAVRDYLGAAGEEMSEDELRHADTGDHVFLAGKFTIADAIEDVTIRITV